MCVILIVVQVGILGFVTFVFAVDPWSGVQPCYLLFMILSIFTGTVLIWQHWNDGPVFDPSPGLLSIGMPRDLQQSSWDFQPLWDVISFRNPTLRWVYARVFTLVFSCSAVILGRNLVRFRFTRGLTVFGTLADCVWPIYTGNDSRLVAPTGWLGTELRHYAKGIVLCVLTVCVIASLTKVFIYCCSCLDIKT